MATHLLNENAKGVYIISATPFAEDGSIDTASADRLVEFYIERGVTGMTILGMMGEAHKLAPDESTMFLQHVLKRVADRIPVVVGVSSAGLDNLMRLAETAMQAGAAGVMVAPPGGLTTDDRLHAYYGAVCDGLGPDIPLVYQDFPLSTQVALSASVFARMVADFPQLVMLKHEDWPGLAKLTAIRQAESRDGARRVSILVGNGGLYLPQELARGADGAMTGFAYPEMLVDVVSLFQAGSEDEAETLFDAYLPLVRHEQQPGFGLAVRKEILRRRGVIASAKTRAPGPKLSETDRTELTGLMTRLKRRLGELGRDVSD
ncbi:MAG: dihydrodipicolinate synthase family protein [Pseudomonadota bacterium]